MVGIPFDERKTVKEKVKRLVDLKLVTEDEILEAAQEQMFGMGNDGFCLACGEMQDGCEPDARNYKCESCGRLWVYGATEIITEIS